MKNIYKNISIILVLILGFFLGTYILKSEKQVVKTSEEHSEETKEEIKKGKHRGRLFQKDNFTLELAIYEKGVPPEFRAYFFEKDKEINPSEVSLKIELNRFAGKKQIVEFKAKDEYLLGNQEIYEPHSFDVKIFANYKGIDYSSFLMFI